MNFNKKICCHNKSLQQDALRTDKVFSFLCSLYVPLLFVSPFRSSLSFPLFVHAYQNFAGNFIRQKKKFFLLFHLKFSFSELLYPPIHLETKPIRVCICLSFQVNEHGGTLMKMKKNKCKCVNEFVSSYIFYLLRSFPCSISSSSVLSPLSTSFECTQHPHQHLCYRCCYPRPHTCCLLVSPIRPSVFKVENKKKKTSF